MTTMTLKQIDATIASIKKRGAELRKDCHKCLVAVIDHYIENGDYTRLPMLVSAVKDSLGSSLAQAMNQWVDEFVTSLKWDTESKSFVHIPKTEKKIKDVVDYKLKTESAGGSKNLFTGNARDLHFYELEREAKQDPFDLKKAFEQLIARAQRAYEQNVKDGKHNSVTAEQIEVLKSLKLETIKPDPKNDNATEEQPVVVPKGNKKAA